MEHLILVMGYFLTLHVAEFLIVVYGAEDDTLHLRHRWFGWFGAGLSKSFYPLGPLSTVLKRKEIENGKPKLSDRGCDIPQ